MHSGTALHLAGPARARAVLGRGIRALALAMPLALAAGIATAPVVLRDGNQRLTFAWVDAEAAAMARSTSPDAWPLARLGSGETTVRVGRGLLVTLRSPATLESALDAARGDILLSVVRPLAPDTWWVQAPSPQDAVTVAARLVQQPGVIGAYPGYRRLHAHRAGVSPAPDDPYFPQQGYLETPAPGLGAVPVGPDLAIRSAWSTTRGEGVVVAICDDGLDERHPELAPNRVADLDRNFFTQSPGAAHSTSRQFHGTCVAGIVAARDGNGVGIAGTAPRSGVCGWVLFDRSDNLLEIEALAGLFQHANDRVAVQNHSWGNSDFEPLVISDLEANALSNAATLGRRGRGVVHVRAAGNTRSTDYFGRSGVGDANLDGFANSPWAITVGAVRADGRVTSYSTPGACVLVSAFGGEQADGTGPFSLDPVGDDGFNTIAGSGVALADYVYPGRNEVGTSFTSPQVAGLAALLLSARPELTARDVALVLALSARPLAADPVTQANGAGLLTGDNVGFGVPHAGRALDLARRLRTGVSPLREIHRLQADRREIPDDGFRVLGFSGDGTLRVDAGAGVGSSALWDTRPGRARMGQDLPLVDVGKAESALTNDLTGTVALIERRPGTFEDKLNTAAAAGAVAGIVADDVPSVSRLLMLRSEFARIPGAFVSKADGAALRGLASTDPASRFRLVRRTARYEFVVDEAAAVHGVQVRARFDHPRQGDLRVSLVSPAGTVSLLQRPNNVAARQLDAWAYSSRQFLLEGSVGTWAVEFTDEAPLNRGQVWDVELILHGTALGVDADGDGLDDAWERAWFGDIAARPGADPDGDGLSNAAEQALGTDPTRWDGVPASLVPEGGDRIRWSWPSWTGRDDALESMTSLGGAPTFLGRVPGRTPERAWILPLGEASSYFRVRE